MDSFRLTENDKATVKFLVDKGLSGRSWNRNYIDVINPKAKDKAIILYATEYGLGTYYNLHGAKQISHATTEMLEKLKLKDKLEKIIMVEVPELPELDMNYVARRLYPHAYKEPEEVFEKKLTQNLYNAVLDGTTDFPKQYFTTSRYQDKAKTRAIWCLEVYLNENFTTIEEMYETFAQGNILVRLKNAKILTAFKGCGYTYPIDYLHECISTSPEHKPCHELMYQQIRYKLTVVDYNERIRRENVKKKKDLKNA